ncbi:MAG: Transcriptional regulator, TetR family protein [Labilithrix sp.]|nr:Transcriptional regulator, TetR family protein [Labilithrix sp.]
MRYPPGHKAEARNTLVRASGSLAKKEGFAGSGVDALAGAAGLTSGAFYRHFDGKTDLLSAIVETELETTRGRFASIEPRSEEQLLRAIDGYLSLAHVRRPESGCLLPTLAPEIARAPAETRTVFERALADLAAVLSEKIGDRAVASALISQCVGAVMIARALATEEAKREVLEAARRSARAMLASRARR